MALILMEGFDADDTTLKWFASTAPGSVTTTRFSGGRAVSIANGNIRTSFTATGQVFVGFAVSISNLDVAVRPYISLLGDGGATQHLSLGYSSTSLILYRGNVGGTVLATYAKSFTAAEWYWIEVSATIADSGSTCVVKLNGATVINFSGDTKNGGTNTTIDTLLLGSNGGYTAYYDDVYVCDTVGSAPYNTFLGEVRIRALPPSGAGSSTQFTPSTGANYTAVDELPYSASDYVSSGTVGHLDTYAMTDLPASGAILAVQHNVIAKKNDAAGSFLKPVIRSGGVNYYGSTATLIASDAVASSIFTTNPNTSTAWTQATLNATEAGFEVG